MTSGIDWSYFRPSLRSELMSLIQQSSYSPNLIIYGPKATGKSTLLIDCLIEKHACYAVIDCAALTSERMMLHQIVRQLEQFIPLDQVNEESINQSNSQSSGQMLFDTGKRLKARTVLDAEAKNALHLSKSSTNFRGRFAELRRRLTEIAALKHRTTYIVVRHAELLSSLSNSQSSVQSSNAIRCLLSLTDACLRHISIIFISQSTLYSIETESPGQVVLPIYFPPYSKAHQAEIVAKQLLDQTIPSIRQPIHHLISLQTFQAFILSVAESLAGSINNIRELYQAIRKLLPKLEQVIVQQSIEQSNKQLNNQTDSYYIRHMRAELASLQAGSVNQAINPSLKYTGLLSHSQSIILIASYIASHVHQQKDAALFTTGPKATKRARKSEAQTVNQATVQSIPRRLREPKAVSLERLLAIAKFLDEDLKVEQAYSDLQALVDLRLTERTITATKSVQSTIRRFSESPNHLIQVTPLLCSWYC